jgi:SAM-dependent methyltransferase
VACDVCHAPFAAGSFDVVISPSTLDHFDNRQEFLSALQELERLVRPGGVLVITLDNPANPLYHVLRWASKSKVTGYPLGYTQTASGLEKDLRALRLEVFGRDWLLHNPRGISTLIFLAIRRALGRHADGVIRGLLGVFSLLGRLPTRSVTGCFLAVLARKPTVSPGRCKGPGSCA